MTHLDQGEPSPFHQGELEVQERMGVREKIDGFARRVIRDHMTDQHREFYALLPFVLLGTVDDQGQPWASIIPGRSGFMSTPDARHLEIATKPLYGDPLNETLKPGGDIGLLGILPEARRRNRMTGRVRALGPAGISIETVQSFGNCPQYIQTRAVDILPTIDTPQAERPLHISDKFDPETRTLIEGSDTLFIATAFSDGAAAASRGADVSHRGGKPGFVRVEDNRTFVFPDFSGNLHFNTVGNIVVNPKAGFLFADFDTGDLVYMTGQAEVVWEGPEVEAFAGAERLIRFRAEKVIRVEHSLPLRFDFGEYSPMLDQTGSWQQAAETIAANKQRNAYLPYEVFDVQRESDIVSSFYLRRADGAAVADYKPGQFLPIRLSLPGEAEPAIRTYTVSDAPNGDHYRLSIKREGGDALVSNFFHDHVTTGYRLEAMAPRGKFALDQSSERPVVLLSAGVGITPMIAMANNIVNEGKRTRQFRKTYFIHGAQNSQVHAFGDHVRQLADAYDSFTSHIRFSDPGASDQRGTTHDSEGRIDMDLLRDVLPLDDYDFYLCGPQPFMQALYDGLVSLGVRDERINYESFGPATVLKHDTSAEPATPRGEIASDPVNVSFTASNVDVEWSPDKGTLLELAEASGLNPAFSCRSGICGSCATPLKSGTVDYIEEPSAPHGEDEVLICSATPRSTIGDAACGEDCGVILDL